MNTWTSSDSATVIHYNSDLSGRTRIIRNKNLNDSLDVPAEHLLDFVAEYVRANRIRKLEQMSTEELLDGPG